MKQSGILMRMLMPFVRLAVSIDKASVRQMIDEADLRRAFAMRFCSLTMCVTRNTMARASLKLAQTKPRRRRSRSESGL